MAHLWPPFALLLLLSALWFAPASCATVRWVAATSGAWSDAAMWSTKTVPTSADDVILPFARYTVTIDVNAAVQSINIGNCFVVLTTGRSLTVSGALTSVGSMDLESGASLTAGSIALRESATAFARFKMTEATVTSKGIFTHEVQVLYAVGNCTIVAAGGFQWRSPLQLAAGSASMPTCTVNSILNIIGDVVGLDLLTFASSRPPYAGTVVISGALNLPGSGTIRVIPPTAPSPSLSLSASVVYYGSITPATATVRVRTEKDTTPCIAPTSDPFTSPPPNPDFGTGRTTSFDPPVCAQTGGGSIGVIIGPGDCSAGRAVTCPVNFSPSGSGCIPACVNSCSSRGTCIVVNGNPTCNCSAGYVGADCSAPSCTSFNNCNGLRGSCVATAGAPQCVCNTGWSGADCSTPLCNCNANQYCEALLAAPECKCNAGWTGADCMTAVAATSASFSQCPGACSGADHGQCDARTGQCTCFSGWMGADCSVPQCLNDCSLHGVCSATTHTCQCQTGWEGIDCSLAACVGCTNGACATAASPPQCVCLPGWYGVNCTVASLSEASSSNHGLSSTGRTFLIAAGAIVGAAIVGGAAVYFLKDKVRCITRSGDGAQEYMLQ